MLFLAKIIPKPVARKQHKANQAKLLWRFILYRLTARLMARLTARLTILVILVYFYVNPVRN